MNRQNTVSTPEKYIDSLEEGRKQEIRRLFDFMRSILPKYKPFMQSGMIGWAIYHYKYASGREGDWPSVALASNKNYISVYVMGGDGTQYVAEKYKNELPKANIGKSCIRFKRVDDIDLTVLEKVIFEGMESLRRTGELKD